MDIIKIVVLTGPTAVGKTKYAIHLAKALDGEIISADSMQIYKDMNIGSAKPSISELKAIPHHLIGEIDPLDNFTVAEYQKLAEDAICNITSKGKLPIICGGTGLYINSIIYEMDFANIKMNCTLRKELEKLVETEGKDALYKRLEAQDPESAKRIHPNNIKKIIRAIEVVETTKEKMPSFTASFKRKSKYDVFMVGLRQDRKILYEKINQRVDDMIGDGLLSEVQKLREKGLTLDFNSMKGIGYKELFPYFLGECNLEEAIDRIKINSRKYAKRQMTWFRRYKNIKWFDIDLYDSTEELAEEIKDNISKWM